MKYLYIVDQDDNVLKVLENGFIDGLAEGLAVYESKQKDNSKKINKSHAAKINKNECIMCKKYTEE